jgi:hypothetical protein
MEATASFETLVSFCQTALRHIPAHSNLQRVFLLFNHFSFLCLQLYMNYSSVFHTLHTVFAVGQQFTRATVGEHGRRRGEAKSLPPLEFWKKIRIKKEGNIPKMKKKSNLTTLGQSVKLS